MIVDRHWHRGFRGFRTMEWEWSHHLPLRHPVRSWGKSCSGQLWLIAESYFDLVWSTDACITMPPAICAQIFKPTLAWATPIPEAIIIYSWRSQIQNITKSLLNSKEPSSGMDSLKTLKNYPQTQHLKMQLKTCNWEIRYILFYIYISFFFFSIQFLMYRVALAPSHFCVTCVVKQDPLEDQRNCWRGIPCTK